jgi:hypothetical protein
MTEYDLYGPWTGNALHAPENPRRSWRPHVLLILAALAIISGALIALSN